MSDRDEIMDVLADYAWGNDAKDEAALHSVFADDARFSLEIAGVDEPIGPFEGREAIVDFIYSTVRAQTDQRRHVIPNVRMLELTAEAARLRCYLILNAVESGVLEVKSSGVYEIALAKRDGAWRMTSMHLALDAPF